MNQAAHNPYQTSAVDTAGPAQLVLMLYDRVLTGCIRVRQAEGDGSRETVNYELQRIQAILMELRVTLDHEQGGQIAANLASLYDYCRDRVIRANVSRDVALLDAVESAISELRDAWATACVSGPVTVGGGAR